MFFSKKKRDFITSLSRDFTTATKDLPLWWRGKNNMRPIKTHTDKHGRVCTICGKYKTWENFFENYSGKNGKMARCMDCHREYSKERTKTDTHRAYIEFNETEQKCSTCGVWKPFELFNKSETNRSGRLGYCKECNKKKRLSKREETKKYRQEYYRKNKDNSYGNVGLTESILWEERQKELHKNRTKNDFLNAEAKRLAEACEYYRNDTTAKIVDPYHSGGIFTKFFTPS